jgi:hypothetical protein
MLRKVSVISKKYAALMAVAKHLLQQQAKQGVPSMF